MTPLPCPRCLDIELTNKIANHDHDAEKQADVHERAQVHVDYHRAGLAQGQLTDGVKQIANDNSNGGK